MKSFYVKREKHFLDPEEVLLDRKTRTVGEAKLDRLESPVSSFLVKGVFVLCLAFFAIIWARLFYLQIVQGEDYRQRAENNRTNYYIVSAPRGIIYDRYGEPLVFNSPSFSLVMIPLNLPAAEPEREAIINQIENIFAVDRSEIESILSDPQTIHSFQPILIKANLEIEEVRLFETNIAADSGFSVISDYSRHYLFGEALAHVLGYIGKISAEDIDEYRDYPLTSMVGKDGLEAYYERILQGKPGKNIIEVDANLNLQKDLGSIEPQKGQDITLTIDKDLQLELYNSLRERVENLGVSGAAGIILDVHSGEILSLVSVPSFDPDVFTKGAPRDTINQYLNDSSLPLFDRAVSGLYPPGSVIKPLMALAALEEDIIDPDVQLFTDGKIVITSPYNAEEQYVFNDWRNNGWVDMREAIAVSCNVYFWAVGGGWQDVVGLGLEKIKDYWREFDLYKKTGIDLWGEAQSILPDAAWLAKNRPEDPEWKLGDTYNISIGEGGLALTPLQMAVYISTIANGGSIVQPHLLQDGRDAADFEIGTLDVSPENLQIVQEGMRQVVTIGTATDLNSLPMAIAGKSGSPKFVSGGEDKYHAIFGAYAPYEDPQIAVLVLIESPPSQTVATLPVIKDVMQWYWDNRMNTE